MENKLYCVIMAGGIGSRFWPMSRNDRPKQFLDILGTGKTFLRQTFERLRPLVPDQHFLVVTSSQYRELVLEQLPEIRPENVLCEPMRRNTAPCIAYASFRIRNETPDARIIVTPADHLVLDPDEFRRVISQCDHYAQNNDALLTIGIAPSRAETGYGYIQVDANVTEGDGIYKVKRFTEKPDRPTAESFLREGGYLWNSGLFVWSLPSILAALEKYTPGIHRLFAAGESCYRTSQEQEFIDRIYPESPNISVDYAIMEKADNVYVCSGDFGWSDIGTWGSLFEHSPKDGCGNVSAQKNVYTYDTRNTVIKADPEKLVVTEGLEDYIVVDSDDILLIYRRKSEQSLRDVVEDLKKEKKERFL